MIELASLSNFDISTHWIPLCVASVFLALLSRIYFSQFWKSAHPCILLSVPLFNPISNLLPFSISYSEIWTSKFKIFEKHNSTVLVFYSLFEPPHILLSDDTAIAAVFADKETFAKPFEDYKILRLMGKNVVTEEGAAWRAHRKLVGPSFSEKNNKLVWRESIRLIRGYFEMLESQSNIQGTLEEADSTAMCLRLALMVISTTALGMDSDWKKTSAAPRSGMKLSFMDSLHGSLEGLLYKLLLPTWVYSVPFLSYPKHVQNSFDELESNLKTLVMESRIEGGKNDLLSLLAQQDTTSEHIDEQSVIGNLFIIMLAGHETSAHTLAFMMTLLALYPEHQDIICSEAAAFENGDLQEEPDYSNYSRSTYAQAVIYESLRLYSPVPQITRIARFDVDLLLRDNDGTPQRELKIKPGSRVTIALSALHYNPTYWPEPGNFQPSRFLDTEDKKWNRNAFNPFAAGGRACIGQKFAMVELVAIISQMCLAYRILIPEHLKETYEIKAGETEIERRERIFKPFQLITLAPGVLPVTFQKRGTL